MFQEFLGTKNTKHQSYAEYSNRELLRIVFYKGIVAIESMQSMAYEFMHENVTKNILYFFGEREKRSSVRGYNQ